MALRQPKPYTVLITATGKVPITLTLNPWVALATGILAVGVPMATIAGLAYHNWQLAQQNQALTDTASEVLTELNVIGSEIRVLKHRAGVSEVEWDALSPNPESTPQGGQALEAPPELMLATAQRQLPALSAVLATDVRPALEATLEAESDQRAAFPDGKPVAGEIKVSSEFGLRSNPFGGRSYEVHEGIDFAGPVGQPILATADGVVVKADYDRGYGNHIKIDHGYHYETLYAHLSTMTVKLGDRVQRGDVIGHLGNTGRSSGPHLHYGIYRNGRAMNPRYFLKLETRPEETP
ncbi:M23 family metallopeptidase [Phormidium sp. FACHB-1136]|uniref:M23 family metallopeptidase n=1 Tax=Phormidium sp. FACHB-1136 TaxID=2692848 RepID=UPI00168241DE|nr:M23 family metallopeptidase [Phormidium sp. FACHB-1136]MBD2428216.1 M23 family metallopeptidase [Phormidium sp. FACHB-1136]